MSEVVSRTVTINDLPTKVKINMPESPSAAGSVIMTIIGFVMLVVGGLFIIFGPDRVYVGSHMSFVEFLQLFPGPIATVGGFLIGVGNWLAQSGDSSYRKAVDAAVGEAVQIQDDEVPDGFELAINKADDEEIFLVELVEKKADDAAREVVEGELEETV